MTIVNKMDFMRLVGELTPIYEEAHSGFAGVIDELEKIVDEDIVSRSTIGSPWVYVKKEDGHELEAPYAKYVRLPSKFQDRSLDKFLNWIEITMAFKRPEDNIGSSDYSKADYGYVETRITLRHNVGVQWSDELNTKFKDSTLLVEGDTLIIKDVLKPSKESPYTFLQKAFANHAQYLLGLNTKEQSVPI
ncbi:MAG: hypothetical protein ABIJ34_01490 [archaeon]